VARPRVVIASRDADVAVKLVSTLNPRRYRVEHVFDLSEALLRAELVLAHALVVHAPRQDPELARRCAGPGERVALVFVSERAELEALAQKLGARFVPLPIHGETFQREVFQAVAQTNERRTRAAERPRTPSGTHSVVRVLMLVSDPLHASVMGAVLHKELGVTCLPATTTERALAILEESVDCVVAEAELLMGDRDGVSIARKLTRRGIPLIPISPDQELDPGSAGQLAWDIVPQVRRSLVAREKGGTRAAG
jgi:DNA-binding response OmpR family regulator